MWLLDTNILSEAVRPRPDSRVVAWFEARRDQQDKLHIAAVSLAEIRRGVLIMAPDHPRVPAFRRWIEVDVPIQYRGRILPFDESVANRWADMSAALPRGLNIPVFDSIIAATALQRGLTVVTRNLRDFARIPGLSFENPFHA